MALGGTPGLAAGVHDQVAARPFTLESAQFPEPTSRFLEGAAGLVRITALRKGDAMFAVEIYTVPVSELTKASRTCTNFLLIFSLAWVTRRLKC